MRHIRPTYSCVRRIPRLECRVRAKTLSTYKRALLPFVLWCSTHFLTLDDLRRFEPPWREPVLGEYRGHRVASFPPPSSGGAVLVQALNVLEGFDLSAHRAGDAAAIHLVATTLGHRAGGFGPLLRSLGFAALPLVLLVLGALPLATVQTAVWFAAHGLAVCAMIVCAREVLAIPLSRAALVCLLAVSVGWILLAILGWIADVGDLTGARGLI